MDTNYYNNMMTEILLKPSDILLSVNKHQNIECLLCGDIFYATPKSKVFNYKKWNIKGCPKCTWKIRYDKINSKNINKLEQKFEILSDYGDDNYIQLTVKNKECGHVFTSRKGNLLNRNIECPVCNTVRKRKFYQDINEERHKDSLATKTGYTKYKHSVYKLTRASYRNHKKEINPNNLKRALAGNPGYHLDHIVSVKYCFQNDIPVEICSDYRNLTMTEWRKNIVKNQKPVIRFPDIFYPYVKAIDKITNFIYSIKNQISTTFEPYIDFDPYILTLFNDELKLGLMFITLNEYRQQTIRTIYYFRNMKKLLEDKGIKILFIFEDEWVNNEKLVIQKIKHLFNINTDVKKIFARKCIIKEISVKEKSEFLKENHIQGTAIAKIRLGAFYQNELVAVMTFANPRIAMNKNIVGSMTKWELVRFATKNNYHVIGIASKLLHHFEKNYEWQMIYSFADLRWSTGNLYYQLNFKLDRVNKPEYFYIENGIRKHRYNFRKDIIKHRFKDKYDPLLTEYQNMLNVGYDRIWDCGTLKFIKTKV